MNLDHCADTSRNVTGLWEGKQDNECGLLIRDLKVKGSTLRCCFPPQAMWISAVLVRHWVAEGLLWQGCFPLSLRLPEVPVTLLPICSPSMLLTFLPAESSLLQWGGRGYPSPRPKSCTLPAPGFAWNKQAACLCAPMLWKTHISQSSFPEKKLVPICGYQHMQISWNRNETCSV